MKDQIRASLTPAAVPSAPAAAPEPATPAASPAPVTGPGLSGEALWQATSDEFGKKFPLQAGYAAEMHFLSADERTMLLGAPSDQRMAMQSLERPGIRAALEEILTKFAGRRVLVKFEVRDDLKSRELVLPADAAETGTAASPPLAAGAQPRVPPSTPIAAPPAFDVTEFQNDPLIREALRLFEASITKKS